MVAFFACLCKYPILFLELQSASLRSHQNTHVPCDHMVRVVGSPERRVELEEITVEALKNTVSPGMWA